MARPVGLAGQAWRWCWRSPRLAASVGFAVLSLVVGVAGIACEWRRADDQRARAEANEYVLSINAAQQALNANNPGRALELLNRYQPGPNAERRAQDTKSDPRGFEWRYLWQYCQSGAEVLIGKLELGVRSLDVSPDGQWLYAGSTRAAPKVWNLATGEELPFVSKRATWGWGAFSPDSRYLALADQGIETGSYGAISIWDLPARNRLAPIIDGRPLGSLDFSSDGKRLGYLALLPPGNGAFVAVDFPGGQKVAELTGWTNGPDNRKGWDWVFSHDGRSFIGSDFEFSGGICLCDLTPGSKPREFPGHHEGITAIAISPDGRTLATGAAYTETVVKLWEVPSLRLLADLAGHQAWIAGLKFSPDGLTLASAAADQTVRLWDVPSRKARQVLAGLPADVWRLCFSSDGHKLFTGSADGSIHQWPVEGLQRGQAYRPSSVAAGLYGLTMAPNARRFAGLRAGRVSLGQIGTSTNLAEIPELGTNNTCLLFTHDGQSLLAGKSSGEIGVWSLDGHQPLHRLRGISLPVHALRQDQESRTLVAVHWRGRSESNPPTRPEMDYDVEVQVWRTTDWLPQPPWELAGSWGRYAVSANGRWFAADGAPGTIQVRNLSSPHQTNILSFLGEIRNLTFSPDSRLLAAASDVGSIRIWELPRLNKWIDLRARPHALWALAFSPDGRRLATAGEGAEAVNLWDVATWQKLISLSSAGRALEEVFFSADGNQLVVLSAQGDLLFWRAPSFTEIDKKAAKATAR